jgi:phage gpG-like protein
MSLSIALTQNTISPDIAKKAALARNPERVWQAAGLQVVSITKRAFRDASMRSSAWPSKAFGGGASNLIRKGVLLSSIRIVSADKSGVTVGSDRKYAAIHQLGGVIKAKPGKRLVFRIGGKTHFAKSVRIPARPYFPFTPSGDIAPQHKARIEKVIVTAADKQLLP